MNSPHHFVYDFQDISPIILGSPDSIRVMVANIVHLLDMTPVGDIIISQMIDPDRPTTHCGITAVQIIKESLIDVHTYTESGCLYLSIFSCRRFDQLKVFDFLTGFLGSKMCWMNSIFRMRCTDGLQ
jgi:S-adenosylmethionine/arginine decarboxylase-like enzyme